VSDDPQTEADRRLEAALAETGARDPREFYRERLRELKQADRGAYEEAVGYYRDTLVPSVAGGADPLPAWTEYGRKLAALGTPGRTVMVDATGVAAPYQTPAPSWSGFRPSCRARSARPTTCWWRASSP
jgi:hypothetical protein